MHEIEPERTKTESRLDRRGFIGGATTAGAALALTGTALAGCGSSSPGTTAAATTPKQGGTLAIGIGGGSPADTFDPHVVDDAVVELYTFATFDQLLTVQENEQIANRLAEEFSSNKTATEWTIRVRKGVEFHNGKTLTADDVIYTFQRIINPKSHATAAWLGSIITQLAKVDKYTVKVTLRSPFSWFPEAIGDGGLTSIVPVGFDSKHPVGTGPFKYVSLTPGQMAVVERFPNYWGGPAYLDKLVINTINDDNARLNALLTGQVDLVQSILTSQVPQVTSNNSLTLYNSPSQAFSPFTMRVDKAPFSDVRVRQALRMCINRKQLLEQAYSGYGFVGNDLYSPFDPAFDASLVRPYDPEQARSLLKAAGVSGSSAQLTVSQLFPGIVQQAEVWAQNAAQVGFNIKLNQVDPATLYGPNFLQWPFAMNIFPGLRFWSVSVLANGPSSMGTTNETHFHTPQYERLFNEGSATLDPVKQKEIVHEMQRILFDEGGYVIPAFPHIVAAYQSKVGGIVPHDPRGFGPVSTSLNRVYISA